jgi:hypothetical protein
MLYDAYMFYSHKARRWDDAEPSLPVLDRVWEKVSTSELEEKLKDETSPFLFSVRADALTQETVSFLRGVPLLKGVCIWGCLAEPRLFETLKSFESLAELWIHFESRIQLTDKFAQRLSEFANITRLNLFSVGISDAGMKALCKLRRLERLGLSCEEITDEGLSNLPSLTNLVWLSVYECKEITDLGLEFIAETRNVTYLNLNGLEKLTDSLPQYLRKLERLDGLTLFDCSALTEKMFEGLPELSSITELAVKLDEITNEGLEYLARMTNITDLTLYSQKLRDEALLVLVPLKNLQKLALYSPLLTHAVFRNLALFPSLNDAALFGVKVANASYKDLWYCSDIENLVVGHEMAKMRTYRILKERQSGREWAFQHCNNLEEPLCRLFK